MTLRGWLNLIKTLAITLAPIYITALLIWYIGFRLGYITESILASILFVQIYVMVVQAEAMLRQAAWAKAAYDVIFKVSSNVDSVDGKISGIKVENCGQTPAYNFFIGLSDETTGNPIEYQEITLTHELEQPEGYTLSVGRERTLLFRISEEEFINRKIRLHISYENVLGHSREVQAISFEGSKEFFMIPVPVEPGFLIKAFGDLLSFFHWQFRYKKLLRK